LIRRLVFRPQARLEILEAANWYASREDDTEIVIVACMHARRDPKRWKDRLQG